MRPPRSPKPHNTVLAAALLTGLLLAAGASVIPSLPVSADGMPSTPIRLGIPEPSGGATAAGLDASVGPWFSYQGRLTHGGSPVAGACAFGFRLYGQAEGGSPVAPPLATDGEIEVEDGLVSFALNFGADAFNGEERWLVILVDCGDGAFTLAPRTKIHGTPYAWYASRAPWTGIFSKSRGAGTGLVYNDHSFHADFSVVQRRIDDACPNGQAMRAVRIDGTPECIPVGQAGGGGLELPFDGRVNLNNTSFSVQNQGNGIAIRGKTEGNNAGVQGEASGQGHGVIGFASGTGIGGYFQVLNESSRSSGVHATTEGVGHAAAFIVSNAQHNESVMLARTNGRGEAAEIRSTSTNAQAPALEVSGKASNAGIAAMRVSNEGRGAAGFFRIQNTNSGAAAVSGATNGTGNTVGVQGTTSNGGAGIHAIAANGSQTGAVSLLADHNGNPNGDIAVFRSQGVKKARINAAGRGFFNGGTQNSGADVAEAFEVVGDVSAYGPGEVLAIAPGYVRRLERAVGAYTTLVAGVVATRPGLLLTERDIEADLSDTVPLAVIGVVPTMVSAENGPIRAGDLLVVADTPGHAMRGTEAGRMLGAIIGKALADFDGPATGTIPVLVGLR